MDNKVFLFPLNNSVLFKKVTLPYHIFEAKYKRMIHDSIRLKIPVAVIPFDPSNMYRNEVCVAGHPHVLATYPDGRMDIYVTGTVKCRLSDFISEDPYNIYYYRQVQEDLLIDDSYMLELESLKILLERWSLHFLPDPVQRENFSNTLEDPELMVNYCTVFLVDDAMVKKEVMEASSLKEKIQLILQVIGPKEISLGPFMPTLKF
ncbi:MAG TPA: LON peptidase substrate-binding domain-containing protein [Bacteriovoracaceae bacterium]|nr:LON peptidase substrate-binding domain-containing protein [Bacteriovoracaceae bacterium]